jgi:YegS/Rv2252/BmrU family lipid kinase
VCRRILIIFNPEAGMGRGRRVARKIMEWRKQISKERGIEIDVKNIELLEQNKSAMINLSKAIERDDECIAIVGGDSTVNLLINLLRDIQIPIGIIPVGTANDLAKELGIPNNPRKALDLLVEDNKKIQPIDIGEVIWKDGRRYFVTNFSVGFDTEVVRYAEALKQKLRFLSFLPNVGVLIYAISLFRALFFYSEYPDVEMEIRKEGFTEKMNEEITSIIVCNNRRYGKIFTILPNAEIIDGLLDICKMGKMGKFLIFINLFRALRGTLTGSKGVKIFSKIECISISSLNPLICQMDGDTFSIQAKEFEIFVLPKQLRIIVPA